MTDAKELLDYDSVPDSRRLRPPTVDERVRDLEVLHDAKGREMIDLHARLKSIEGWPSRIVAAVLAGSIGIVVTVIGGVWSMASSVARMEASLDALTVRIERIEDRLDRIEERAWSSSHSNVPRMEE